MPTPRAASCLPSSSSDVFAHAGVLPLAASLVPPDASAAADAVALQHELRRLSRRERLRASQSSVLAAAHEYGVSATIHSLVLATLDSFGRNHTLFAPKLVLWSDRTDCSRADLSCFFGSLPSLDETTTLTAPRGVAATTPRVAVDGVRPSLWRHFIGLWFGAGSAHAVPTEQPAALGSLEKLAAAMRTRMQAAPRSANACRKAGGGCPRVLPALCGERRQGGDTRPAAVAPHAARPSGSSRRRCTTPQPRAAPPAAAGAHRAAIARTSQPSRCTCARATRAPTAASVAASPSSCLR